MRSKPETPSDQGKRETTPSGRPARVIISVQAGLVPGQSMKELERRWTLDADEADDQRSFLDAQGSAMAYALHLQNPRITNFVRLDWIWL